MRDRAQANSETTVGFTWVPAFAGMSGWGLA
ncbi:hypothetical protein BH11PSE1_BH11PSE1_10430 [soil metagenome]